MSFDLKPLIDPLIDLGPVSASGLFISAPNFGLTNYDLLGSLVASPRDGAVNKDVNVSGSNASSIGEKMMMHVAKRLVKRRSRRVSFSRSIWRTAYGTNTGRKAHSVSKRSVGKVVGWC